MMRLVPRGLVIAYGLVVVLALGVRLAYWAEIRGTPFAEWHLWAQTDMATYVEQARRIAGGDWLAPEPYHPYHVWQKNVGTEEEWLAWYGPHGFHQAPLYSYLLAMASKLTVHYLEYVRIAQLILGAGTALLLALVARQLAGDVAGVASGVLCALYGPLIFLEANFLREGPSIFGLALLLWLVVRHVRLDAARHGRSAAGIGLLLGVLAMFHEFAIVLAAATLLILAVHAASGSLRRATAVVPLLAAGYLVGFSPLLARNIAVGASPLSISSRSHLTLALANMSTAADSGITFTFPGPEFRRIMAAAGPSTWGVIGEIWRGYEGHRATFFGHWLRRLGAACWTVEIPDNVSFSFHRAHLGVLRGSVTYGVVFPMAVTAMTACGVAAAFQRRPRPPPRPIRDVWSVHRAAHLAVLAYLPPLLIAATLVNVQGRYRLILVPILLCYSGVLVAMFVRCTAARRFGTAAGLVIGAAVIMAIQHRASVPMLVRDRRAADPIVIAERYAVGGNLEAAAPFYREALDLNPGNTTWLVRYSNVLARLGRHDEALRALRRIEAVQPEMPGLQESIRRAEQRATMQRGDGR